MKKLTKLSLLLVLSLIVALSFAACGEIGASTKQKHTVAYGNPVTIEGYQIAVDTTFEPLTVGKLGLNTASTGKTFVGVQVNVKASAKSKSPYSSLSDVEIKLEYNGTVYAHSYTASVGLYSDYNHGSNVVLTDLAAGTQYNLPFAFEVPASGFDMSKAFIYVETDTDEYRFDLTGTPDENNNQPLTIKAGEKISNIEVDTEGKECELIVETASFMNINFILNNSSVYSYVVKNKSTQEVIVDDDSLSHKAVGCYLQAGSYTIMMKASSATYSPANITLYVVTPTVGVATLGQTVSVTGANTQDTWYTWQALTLTEAKQIMLNAAITAGDKMGHVALFQRNTNGSLTELGYAIGNTIQDNNRTPNFISLDAGTYYVSFLAPNSSESAVNYAVVDIDSCTTDIVFDSGVASMDLDFTRNNSTDERWFKLVLITSTSLQFDISVGTLEPFVGVYADVYTTDSGASADRTVNVNQSPSQTGGKPTSLAVLEAGTYYIRTSAIWKNSPETTGAFNLTISQL